MDTPPDLAVRGCLCYLTAILHRGVFFIERITCCSAAKGGITTR